MKNSFMYSPTTQGFYPKDEQAQLPYVEAGSLPTDLIDISDEDYDAWFNPPEGKYGAWVDGHPVLADLPPVNHEAINTAKREELITAALATVAAINTKLNMGRTLTQAEKDKMNKVLDYVDALNELDMTQPEITWPAL